MRTLDKGFVVWFTGLPGSGKTTVAKAVEEKLSNIGFKTELLDGDWVRKTINPDAGFTRDERRRHLIRVAWIARLLARNGVAVLCSFVSPYKDVRAEIRKIVEEDAPFIEVYTKCSLQECIRRDPKGLYKKALSGEIKNFTGLDDPYEEPENPELVIDTEHDRVEENVNKVLEKLKEANLIRVKSNDTKMSGEDKVAIHLSRELYEKAEKFVKESGGFSDVNELIEFLLNEVLTEEGSEYKLSKEEEEEVKKRLRSLGYI
ncbi:MAG: adenylyl-sulfate kinase [Thaumarchaeota archaeon]|nr:MAG: adenylyl-sulfate kinase [Nitrososphaerota archaeon]